jgi:large subunit ribosomal protein L25
MSNSVSLAASLRTGTGKQAAKQLRRDGLIPGIVYGGGSDPEPVQVPELAILYLLRHTSLTSVVSMGIDGGTDAKVLVRAPIRHPLTDKLIHVDFLRVSESSRVTINVPVEIIGHAAGIEAGGILDIVLHEISLDCAAMSIPDHIQVDVSALEMGQNISVSDLDVPDGINIHTDHDATIATVSYPIAEVEEEEEEIEGAEDEMTEPELIGGKEEDDEEEEDE